MKKDYKVYPPIMEGFSDETIRYSIDFASAAAPIGTEFYFKKYGYFVLEGFSKITNCEEHFESVSEILKNKLRMNIKKNKNFIVIDTFNNKTIKKKNAVKSDLVACSLFTSNLKSVPIYIDTKNGEKHCVLLEPDRVIVYDKSVKVKRHNPDFNKFQLLLSKLIPVDSYSIQYFAHFDYI